MKKENYQHLTHSLEAVYREDSSILILGSFPSVKSREMGFYYGHPQNRFWKVVAALFEEAEPRGVDDRKNFLFRHQIALYDVVEECDIIGSSDASIRHVIPARLSPILKTASIRGIYCNGSLSYRLYQRYQQEETGREAVKLPSTSAANARWSLEKLVEAWALILH